MPDLFSSMYEQEAASHAYMDTTFPDLSGERLIAVDTETRDDSISAGMGPGQRRGGYIVGISVSIPDGRDWYFPMRHASGAGNIAPERVVAWCKDNLTGADKTIVGHNLIYDLDYLANEGITFEGKLKDTMLAAPLLDEYATSYSLEAVGRRYLKEGKAGNAMYEWAANTFGGPATSKAQSKNIWRTPPDVVAPYAKQDTALTLRLYKHMEALLDAEGLSTVYDIECRLLPMLLHMRRTGVRVDTAGAEALKAKLAARGREAQDALNQLAGFEVNAHAGADVARVFDALGVEYPRTAAGAPSFTAPFLQNLEHPMGALISTARKMAKFNGTPIDGILKYAVNGRIHTEFNQLRSDDYGTVSGRFSSSNPNLQNIPARDKEIAPLIRSLFLPDIGDEWVSMDYSQIEYRMMLHYAEGAMAEEVRVEYRENPKTDYHELVAKWANMERKPAKNLNFGVIYGMGKKATMDNYGWTEAQADAFISLYHEKIPYAKPLLNRTSKVAKERGYVKTILGRRCRLSADNSYKALNRILQGGAADIMKKAMVDMWEAGVFDYIVPLITVHDELDLSVSPTRMAHEALAEAKRIMETCVELKLPLMVDTKRGASWGEAE